MRQCSTCCWISYWNGSRSESTSRAVDPLEPGPTECEGGSSDREREVLSIPALNIAGRRTELATFFTTFIVQCVCALQLRLAPAIRAHAYFFSAIMDLASCLFDSPVGRLRITATAEGVCGVAWLKEGELAEVEGRGDQKKAREHLATCTDWLTAYFSGSLLQSPVPRPPLVIPKQGTRVLVCVCVRECVLEREGAYKHYLSTCRDLLPQRVDGSVQGDRGRGHSQLRRAGTDGWEASGRSGSGPGHASPLHPTAHPLSQSGEESGWRAG